MQVKQVVLDVVTNPETPEKVNKVGEWISQNAALFTTMIVVVILAGVVAGLVLKSQRKRR